MVIICTYELYNSVHVPVHNMPGETSLQTLLQHAKPLLNNGQYVFCTLKNIDTVKLLIDESVVLVRENEGTTLVLPKLVADEHKIPYEYIAAWITLEIHSDLAAVGLTAAFSNALAKENISCNVIAGYYHDHIFVDYRDASRALKILSSLSA